MFSLYYLPLRPLPPPRLVPPPPCPLPLRETEDFRLAILPTEDFCVDGLAEVLDDGLAAGLDGRLLPTADPLLSSVLRPVPALPDGIEFSCRLSGCPAPGLPPAGRL